MRKITTVAYHYPPGFGYDLPRHDGFFADCGDADCMIWRVEHEAAAILDTIVRTRADDPLPRYSPHNGLRADDPPRPTDYDARTLHAFPYDLEPAERHLLQQAHLTAQDRKRLAITAGVAVAVAGVAFLLARHVRGVDVAVRLVTRSTVREAGLGWGR